MVSRISNTPKARTHSVDAGAMQQVRQKATSQASSTSTASGWKPGPSKAAIDFSRFNPSFTLSRSGRSPTSPVTDIAMTSGKTTIQWSRGEGFTAGSNHRPLSKAELSGLEKALAHLKGSGAELRPELVALQKVRAAIAQAH